MPQIRLNVEFEFGQEVWNRCGMYDEDYKMKGIVLGYAVSPGGLVMYEVRWADMSIGTHNDFELSSVPFTPTEE